MAKQKKRQAGRRDAEVQATANETEEAAVAERVPKMRRKEYEREFAFWDLPVKDKMSQPAYVTPADHPALNVLAEAMARGFGQPIGWMRNAGGAPAGLLSQALGVPVLFFGTGLPEDRWHDSDESVRVDVLLHGTASLGHFWNLLATKLHSGR